MKTVTDIPADGEWLLSPKWIRAFFAGNKLVDSRRAMLLRHAGRPPVYYFPPDDVALEYMTPAPATDDRQQFWDIDNGRERAAWAIAEGMANPPEPVGYIGLEWSAMDTWFEEDEEVFVHPRDPRVRVETLHSSRRICIDVLGETVAETHAPVLLFETGLPVRYYIPKSDVRLDLIEPTRHLTRCPYKGEAHYYSVKVGNQCAENIAWHYRYPTAESLKIAGMIAFYDERVDALYVDGEHKDNS